MFVGSKIQRPILLTVMLLISASTQAQDMGIKPYSLKKDASLKDHLVQSYQRVYQRMGINPSALTAFANSIQSGRRRIRSIPAYPVQATNDCVPYLTDSTEGRSALLECLANFGRNGLNENLFDKIFEARSVRVKIVPTTYEVQKTVALLLWIQDLIRSKMLSNGMTAIWYVPGKGFLPATQKSDFPFEDGDVALVTGKSSISSMISQVTYPQRKFSHAFMVRKEKGQFASMEALIETGMISNNLKTFNEENLQVVEVHRWADEATRHRIATSASDLAWTWVNKKLPYDFAMDFKTEDKLFCSEVVAVAYAVASGLPVEEFVPELSKIRSKEVFKFISTIGVKKELMPSPGDLAPSKYLKQVAEYRNPKDLSKLWWLMALGDAVIERMEAGYELRPRLWVWGIARGAMGLNSAVNLARENLGVDMNLLPAGLSYTSVATMVTLQKLLYDKAAQYAEQSLIAAGYVNPHDLLSVEPWVLRAHFSYALQQSYFPHKVLNK